MKVQNITDIDKFFKTIDECKGRVELVTGEGDRLESEVKTEPVRINGKHFLQR